ncbi:hypothetical protein [Mucilaginibacter pedocola]|uniref:DUF1835 domain-containing protein n=1 Tax=Mucilaginibacter pedocola TaxID=1792845 RepID=A0A1S9PHN9_9SPHI|nr:hypothetical protein [Mucilaginibacter pedocola]OOQ60461.1 hypothetical protein BC343_24500 [Mucilaginibacter pedocola]
MNSTLHILNGDATLPGFTDAGLDGDIMIWREVLSEGPLKQNIASAEFWQLRSGWISRTYGETPDGYHHNMIVPLEKLSEPYEEINLWFEFDLHCQVNLLGAMMLLNQQTNLSAPQVYLISPAEYPDKPDFMGMGELNGEEMDYLFDNIRVHLSEYDFVLAAEAWQLYVEGDAAKLKTWLAETTFWGNMHNLKPALEAHVKRLEVDSDGLNYIHQILLHIYQSGNHTKSTIYPQFWKTEKIYGMGDSQLDGYLQTLTERNLVKLQ